MMQHIQFLFQASVTNIVTDLIYQFVKRAGRIVDLSSGSSYIHAYSDLRLSQHGFSAVGSVSSGKC